MENIIGCNGIVLFNNGYVRYVNVYELARKMNIDLFEEDDTNA